ncbi:MAG: ROK family protein [Bacteroidales bacterium]|nr:ROK family protein [Bacteroidales bacterium]MBS3776771.1 ROK family protein [Bacteroidales bacterium]
MNKQWYIGIDIGGTKSAVLLIDDQGNIDQRKQIATTKGKNNWQPTVDFFIEQISEFSHKQKISSIGISCGGPLNSKEGMICSPPNLPGWDKVPIVKILTDKFQVPVAIENDANAGALAEWRYGAGKGYNNLIFLTFGTGLGAGLILNGQLYSGTNDLGGEAGHIRLDSDGPIGYNKRGSFEGFCSGTGLSQMMAFELLCLKEQIGEQQMLEKYKEPFKITGKDVVELAKKGDEIALKVIKKSGKYFGKGLSVLLDILNPELIVVGSMAVRLGDLLLDPAREIVKQEALPGAVSACQIVPAELGERIGDLSALCVAIEAETGIEIDN